jgi:hypothetical protein
VPTHILLTLNPFQQILSHYVTNSQLLSQNQHRCISSHFSFLAKDKTRCIAQNYVCWEEFSFITLRLTSEWGYSEIALYYPEVLVYYVEPLANQLLRFSFSSVTDQRSSPSCGVIMWRKQSKNRS